MFQWFFSASASAGAAAFLAFSRLIGAPYGLGICASALASAPITSKTAMVIRTAIFLDIRYPSSSLDKQDISLGTLSTYLLPGAHTKFAASLVSPVLLYFAV